MNIVALSNTVAVSPQIQPADVAEIAAAGYKVIVNNRPEGEEPGQPSSADIEQQARAAGLEYYHMPVTAMDFPGPHFDAFCDLLDEPERPVFAFCRSGTRCANLWVSSREQESVQEAAVTAQKLGFDLGMAARHLNG